MGVWNRITISEYKSVGGCVMNFLIGRKDTVGDLVKKRISYFKEVHERLSDMKTRRVCQLKIATLEMVLNDMQTLTSIKVDRAI
jgi:hypothetical protein